MNKFIFAIGIFLGGCSQAILKVKPSVPIEVAENTENYFDFVWDWFWAFFKF